MELWLPPELQKEIARHPMGMTLLVTDYGKPFSIKGFQQWFTKTARTAGLEGLTAHGLRKACARRWAENGATTKQIASVTGHETLDVMCPVEFEMVANWSSKVSIKLGAHQSLTLRSPSLRLLDIIFLSIRYKMSEKSLLAQI